MEELLSLLRDVADEHVLPRWRRLADGEVMEKHPGDLVTVADREAELAITAWLRERHPDALVLGEEAAAAEPALLRDFARAEHAFTVDPLDGTKNFVAGSADFGLMVAQLRRGIPVRSWIWQPVHRRAAVAERGSGARVRTASGWQPLSCPPAPAQEADWRIATSAFRLRGSQFGGLVGLTGSWVSCAVDYPHLAAGDATSLLYSHTMPWDHAPGTLLATEAGARVCRLDGRDYRTDERAPGHPGARIPWQQWLLVTGDPGVHERIRRALARGLAASG